MSNLLLILLCTFAGVALMVVVIERFGKPMEAEKVAKLSRWIYPLVGLALVLSLVQYYLR